MIERDLKNASLCIMCKYYDQGRILELKRGRVETISEAGGLGGALRPPVDLVKSPDEGPGGEAPEAP
jgi:hypothetical protein